MIRDKTKIQGQLSCEECLQLHLAVIFMTFKPLLQESKTCTSAEQQEPDRWKRNIERKQVICAKRKTKNANS